MSEDITQIAAAAEDYVLGVADNDFERLARAFDVPKAQMKLVGGEDGEETVYSIPVQDVWEKIWSRLPKNPDASFELIDLFVYGKKMATVKLQVNEMFFDHLSLYKVNGAWKIYDKISRPLPNGKAPELDLAAIFDAETA